MDCSESAPYGLECRLESARFNRSEIPEAAGRLNLPASRVRRGRSAPLTENAESRHDPWVSGVIADRRAGDASELRRFSEERVSMRLWHLFVVILGLSLIFTIVRDPVGRIAPDRLLDGAGRGGDRHHGGDGSISDDRLVRRSQGAVCPCGGRRHDDPGLDHRHDDHVVVALRGGVAGAGLDTVTRHA